MRADIICMMFPITIVVLMYCAEDMAMNELAYQSTVTHKELHLGRINGLVLHLLCQLCLISSWFDLGLWVQKFNVPQPYLYISF